MATQADLDLAKRLLAANVLAPDEARDAFAVQAGLLQKGKTVSLERVLVAKGLLSADAARVLSAGDPLVTQPFPGYRLLRTVGEGGSSVVYEATYLANRARVAVKVLHAAQGLRKDLAARFQEEARLLIALDHENIVAGYELGCVGGIHYFSMDYVEGPTILQMIERAGALPAPIALWVTLQVARALAYLHSQGLLHRDVKPGNVMIDATGRARVIDLGLVRHMGPALAAGTKAADEETTVGTVEYIAPEQARGRGDIDVRADIYSLGVTLYHMVVGDVPFTGETSYEVMAKHILSSLETQKVKTRRIPPEVHFVIVKAMSKEREQRYHDVSEAIEDLVSFLPEGGPPRIVLPVDDPAPRAAPARPGRPGHSSPVARPVAPHAQPASPPVVRPVGPSGPPVLRPVVPANPPGLKPVAPVVLPARPPVPREPAAARPVVPVVAKPVVPVARPAMPVNPPAPPPDSPPAESPPEPAREKRDPGDGIVRRRSEGVFGRPRKPRP